MTTSSTENSTATAGAQRALTPLAVLIEARALIATPNKWGKGFRNSDRSFYTYCAAEAIEEATRSFENLDARIGAYAAFRAAAGTNSITDWNDAPQRTHAEVLAAFDKAIAQQAKVSDHQSSDNSATRK